MDGLFDGVISSDRMPRERLGKGVKYNEMECAHCAVRDESLNIIQVNVSVQNVIFLFLTTRPDLTRPHKKTATIAIFCN
jgi:hypothetical protein